jgi:hypothetical protein
MAPGSGGAPVPGVIATGQGGGPQPAQQQQALATGQGGPGGPAIPPPARTNLSPWWRWVHLREEEHHKEEATHQQTRLQRWWLIMQTQKLQKHQR